MGMGMLEMQSFETSNSECVVRARKSLESGRPVMIGYLKNGRLRIGRGVVCELTNVDPAKWRVAMKPLNGALVSDESLWVQLAKA